MSGAMEGNNEPVLLDVRDGVATITLNRPEVRNALDAETWRTLQSRIDEAGSREDIRCVVVTGCGEKAFAAGADLEELAQRTPFDMLAGLAQATCERIERLGVPTIAAVNGHALGGGLELALSCDIRIAASAAKFGLPEVSVGLVPSGGGTCRLTRLVGVGKAKELIFGGLIIDAEEAWRLGIANRVVEAQKLEEEVWCLVGQILRNAPLAVRAAKSLLASHSRCDEACEVGERFAQAFLFTTDDVREGIGAFLEKREPEYRGT